MSPQLQILTEVGARLASMTAANGYSSTVGQIKRATLKPFQTEDLPACNYWPGVDTLVSAGIGQKERELQLFVEYVDRTRDVPFSDVVYELALDVLVALTRTTAAPTLAAPHEPTLGGRVKSLALTSIAPQLGEGQAPWCAVLLTFTVSYRVSVTDPSVFV